MSPAAAYPDSWYAATANLHAVYPALAGATSCDVAVVGGGYTGLSAALELAGRGYQVVLLEAERVGWGASGRNGGQIVTGYNKSMAVAERLLGRDDARRLWDMGEEAKALLANRVARHHIACDLRWGYVLAALRRSHLAECDEMLAEWQAYGYDKAERLDRDGLRARVDSPAYLGGLYDRGGGALHPLNYALGLAAAAARAGVRLFEGSAVTGLETTGGGIVRLTTAGGVVSARYAVLAGNAHLGPLSPAVTARMRPRLMPVGTYIIATERLGEGRARALLPSGAAVADMNFVLNYFRMSEDHRLLFGGGVSYSARPPARLGERLRRLMLTVFPSLADVPVAYCWEGLVGITINRFPDFGRLAPNIVYAQGFSGHGVALTGLAGRLLAEAVAGTAERFDVFARIPHRPFPGGRRLRMPALVLAMSWYRLRDVLGW